ncbi:4-hydroxy-3-methylbut-2-enyl diphosphate reductase [Vulcanibacillus modesticaldus]|uniref:4-hydroxy-3-methylbut-2-enyl diphosphate reductase n=1 Tax=Vulcanibacillus modesticaldus TaxID=337097 RepID=A0A1D2YVM3_9BACI|nr:4-hydroxy-3-methylbut-2-enyl diphosphate reductase [Vulcanibacillus modesticaldus]OEF99717.1 4-hydroxy-3-methylbut-2-enyl diphosphate reductase [Vulcanibacillus modesticaldus]
MNVIKISPRGYCHGVVDAMVIAKKATMDASLPRPIYILGMIVHNQYVVDAFNDLNVISLDGKDRLSLLDQIDKGTVIFTAHGISKEVRKKAEEKGLTVIDATCPDVTKTHNLIEEKTEAGYEIVYIGKKGHPEPEGALGVAPKHVHLVSNEDDVDKLSLDSKKILVMNQTTMSQWDIANIIDKIVEKYPHAEIYNEICMATQSRQEAVAKQAKGSDLVIVVGDPKSNNTNRLAQVAEKVAKVKAHRIAELAELDIEWLKGKKTVAVTAGASTPTLLTKEVIDFLEQFDENDPKTWEKKVNVDRSKILPKIRPKI